MLQILNSMFIFFIYFQKVDEDYSKQGYEKIVSLDCFEFEDEFIDLGIDFERGEELTDGWRLMPYKITKVSSDKHDIKHVTRFNIMLIKRQKL